VQAPEGLAIVFKTFREVGTRSGPGEEQPGET